jgi:hypothetical protein
MGIKFFFIVFCFYGLTFEFKPFEKSGKLKIIGFGALFKVSSMSFGLKGLLGGDWFVLSFGFGFGFLPNKPIIPPTVSTISLPLLFTTVWLLSFGLCYKKNRQ